MAPSLLTAEPTSLRAARARAVTLHPSTADRPAAPDGTSLARLRAEVQAAVDADSLERLAESLGPREVRMLVPGLEVWDDLRAATASLIRLLSRESLVLPLFQAWQRRPERRDIAGLLHELAERWGWDRALAQPYSRFAAEWVLAEDPGIAIQQWLEGQGLSYRDMRELVRSPFVPDTPLMRSVRDAVLTHGSALQLRAEGAIEITKWAAELSPQKHLLFGRNYLTRLETNEWHKPTLLHIERGYGLPKKPRMPQFWAPVPEPVRLAFQRLFIRERIEQAFRTDGDRRSYWIKWIDELADVSRTKAGKTEVWALDFGRFTAIEFMELGNAAYFYDTPHAERLLAGPINSPSDLKEGWYNRLIHAPTAGGWYPKADAMVRTWMRRK